MLYAYYNNKMFFNYQQLHMFALFFLTPMVVLNIISVFFFCFYKKHSSLPGDFCLADQSQPIFTAEVLPKDILLISLHFQDVPHCVLEGYSINYKQEVPALITLS